MGSYPELPWVAEARKHVGLREIKGKQHNLTILSWLKKLQAWWAEDETPWCGVFTAHCLQSSGFTRAKLNIRSFSVYPYHWYRALDYLNYGAKLSKPAYGCIAVKTRNGGGHVAFVVGRDVKTKKLVCLGGNQGNAVSFALYSDSEFEAFMWYGVTANPAAHRYDLPQLTGVTATKVSES